MIELAMDGVKVVVPVGTTIWEAARSHGIEIPVLCHDPRLEPVGVCRMCAVDVGERALAASCVWACEPGMQVQTVTPEVESHRVMLTELLMSDQPPPARDPREATLGGNALFALARRYGASGDRLPGGSGRPRDDSSSVIAVDHQACILCDRCIRARDDIQGNEVIGRSGKGFEAVSSRRRAVSVTRGAVRRVRFRTPGYVIARRPSEGEGSFKLSPDAKIPQFCVCGRRALV